MNRQLILAALLTAGATTTTAQTVKGHIVDEMGETVIGATITVKGTDLRTTSNIDGDFTIDASGRGKTIILNCIGFKPLELTFTGNRNFGNITMQEDAAELKDVVVTSQIAVARKTPVAASTISEEYIEERLGTKEFPEVLKSTPGVHANKVGGGWGDSEIYMRGFDNTNIAVMINGVPMNDCENQNVYWSNWAGLSDVTRHMQTQRGLGASKVSAPSVGGTINIITKGLEAKRGGSVSYTMGNNGMNKIMFNVSSGLSKNGWAFTLLGGRSWGNGYVQGTEYEGYNYFANISKRINDQHQLSLTVTGAPQEHYQRASKYGALTIQGWQDVEKRYGVDGYRFNPTYGFDQNGQRYSGDKNFYHKPQISLNHIWQINDKSNLSTVAYTSIGRGGGLSGQGNGTAYEWNGTTRTSSYSDFRGANGGYLLNDFRKSDGTFDYSAFHTINANSKTGSAYVMTSSKNYHQWYGGISTYSIDINPDLSFYGGIDVRYYKGTHTNDITDLMGGEYYIDNYRAQVVAANNANGTDPAWVYKKLGVGDAVYRDYDSHVWSGGGFFQLEYSKKALSTFISGSLSGTGYSRYDRLFYDASKAKSDWTSYLGGTIKAGANYNLTQNHNVFANLGYISRAPKFAYGAFMTPQSSNVTNPDARNEKIFSVELGYGFHNSWAQLNFNGYVTKWMDKTMTKTNTLENQQEYYMNMTGVGALHMGIELEGKITPCKWFEASAMFSYGDWKWASNATGYAYNEAGLPITSKGEIASGVAAPDHAWATINLDGIRVGGSAQTTAAAGITLKPIEGLRIGLDWNYYGRNYAYYEFTGSNLELGKELTVLDPWEIPAAHQFDLRASYKFKIGGLQATLFGNVDNLFNYRYISKAWNPSSQMGTSPKAATAENIYCFYSFGRTYNVRLKVNF